MSPENTHDQLAMSVTLVSDWYHWLSLVTLCKDFSQHLCRNFWTYGSPLIKKVSRLASEGRHAEAGIPCNWQSTNRGLKNSLPDVLKTSRGPVFDPIKNLQVGHFAKILQSVLNFYFHSCPISLRPQCNAYAG